MSEYSYTAFVFVGDSDDSDTEGGLGNVERVVMRPPGHSGKAKRGHLCFDSSFETGNLGRVDFITENEYDLFVRPDTCNPRARFWFHFSVENVQNEQRVIFNVVNLSRTRCLFQRGMTPVVRSTSRPRWQRMPSIYSYFYRSPEHSNCVVLSFTFAFDIEEGEKYSFALAYPYSFSRIKAIESRLLQKYPEVVKIESFAKSAHNRDVSLVTITDDLEAEVSLEGKRVVVVMARIHPCDSASSFVIQGMMEFLATNHGIARDLRRYVVFKFFPVMCPDGVFLGNSRCTLLGADLNRSWHKANEFHHPVLWKVKQYILQLSQKCNLDFVLDLHASSSMTGVFIQGNSYDSVYRYERHIVFPKMLAQNCPDFAMNQTFYNADLEKEGTTRRNLCMEIGDKTNVYSVEVSMHGYEEVSPDPAVETKIIPYSEEDYLLHGRRVARALWDYYKVTGVIDDSCYQLKAILPASETEGPGEAGFSVLRLKDIARQRELFSLLESFSGDEGDDSDEGTNVSDSSLWSDRSRKRNRNQDHLGSDSGNSRRYKMRSASAASYFKDYIIDGHRFDFLAYRQAMRREQLLDWYQERQKSIQVVGKSIDPPSVRRKSLLEAQRSEFFSKSLDESDNCFMLPSKPRETPRKVLTISTLQLHRAINDRINEQPSASSGIDWAKCRKQYTLPNEGGKSRKKVVGGGGVIARFQSPYRSKFSSGTGSMSSHTLPSHISLNAKELGQNNIFAEIRLDQVSQIRPKSALVPKRSSSPKKSPKKALKKNRPKSSYAALAKTEEEDVKTDSPKWQQQQQRKKKKLKKSAALDSFEEPKPTEYD